MSSYASYTKRPYLAQQSPELDSASSPASSPGAVTPPAGTVSPTTSTFLSSSVSSLWGGIMRRFSSEPSPTGAAPLPSFGRAKSFQGAAAAAVADDDDDKRNGVDGVYVPPQLRARRTASPVCPPPLEPLQLLGFDDDTRPDARLLTPPVAEEIRIMVPARLSIVDEWHLVYSLEQDGASLATLYEKCARYEGKRVGFVLCVKDCEGGVSLDPLPPPSLLFNFPDHAS